MPSASDGTGPASELSAWHSREPLIIHACVVDAARGHWQPRFLQFRVTVARSHADPAAAHAVVGFRVMPPSDVRWGRGASQRATRNTGVSQGTPSGLVACGYSSGGPVTWRPGHVPVGYAGRIHPGAAGLPGRDRGLYGAKLGGDAATAEHAGFKFKLTALPDSEASHAAGNPGPPPPGPRFPFLAELGYGGSLFRDSMMLHRATSR
jgi:hypothetical protein